MVFLDFFILETHALFTSNNSIINSFRRNNVCTLLRTLFLKLIFIKKCLSDISRLKKTFIALSSLLPTMSPLFVFFFLFIYFHCSFHFLTLYYSDIFVSLYIYRAFLKYSELKILVILT